jgi:hypothetical protein
MCAIGVSAWRRLFRIAVIGVGAIGRGHVEYMQSQATLAAVGAADPVPAALRTCSNGRFRTSDDYRKMSTRCDRRELLSRPRTRCTKK